MSSIKLVLDILQAKVGSRERSELEREAREILKQKFLSPNGRELDPAYEDKLIARARAALEAEKSTVQRTQGRDSTIEVAADPKVTRVGAIGYLKNAPIRTLIEKWHGVWSNMLPQQLATDMGNGRLSTSRVAGAPTDVHYSGAQVPLADIIDRQTLADELSWATGNLRIACARSHDGRITLLHCSVERSHVNHGAHSLIVLTFSDGSGRTETFELRKRRASRSITRTSLEGDPQEMKITVSVRTDD